MKEAVSLDFEALGAPPPPIFFLALLTLPPAMGGGDGEIWEDCVS